MPEQYELGIIGMGPAGIGTAMSLQDSNIIKKTVCFERGTFYSDTKCSVLLQDRCCASNLCSIISGIGGASVYSSGKISDYPAGSGLVYFFDSEQQLRDLLSRIISLLVEKLSLKKVIVDTKTLENTKEYYLQKNIDFKYYDVYEFDAENYRYYIKKTIHDLEGKGLQLFDNSEVIDVIREPKTLLFRIIVKTPDGIKEFLTRNLVLATGALDIQDELLGKLVRRVKNTYEIGVRVEAPSNAFGNTLLAHGDLKLKCGAGRTYCVTVNGNVIAYQTGGVRFLEGCLESSYSSNNTNLAVLIKSNDAREVNQFIKRYLDEYLGFPIKQRYSDYLKEQISCGDVNTTLMSAVCGDIHRLLPPEIDFAIMTFIKDVLIDAMGIPEEKVTLIAPELKIIRNLQLSNKFELDKNLYIVGSGTGRFRGILQSLCSGIRCGQLLDGR